LRLDWNSENIEEGNLLVKMLTNQEVNMLGVLMLDGVGGEVDHADVVTVDQGGSWQGDV
jgi:hypothetical protein